MAEASADESSTPDESDEEAYSGLFGAIPYALRASRSWLFKLYVFIGGVAALAVAVLMTFALIRLIAQTATVPGGTLTVSRAFFVIVGLFVVGPLLAPILLVARRHRRRGGKKRYDAALALAGFVFLGSLYVGLLVSVPPAQQIQPKPFTVVLGSGTVAGITIPSIQVTVGALVSVIEFLYALPQIWGLLPPIFAAVLIAVAHFLLR